MKAAGSLRLFAGVLSALFVWAIIGSAATAGLIVSEVSGPPVGAIDFNSVGSTSGTTTRYQNTGSDRDTGQIWTASQSYILESIYLQLRNDPAAIGADALGAPVSLQLYSYSGTTFTLLTTATGGSLPTTTGAGDYLRFQLTGGDQISITAGNKYAYVFLFDTEGTSTRTIQFNNNDTNPYAGGQAIRREFGSGAGDIRPATPPITTNANDLNKDYVFFTEAVPEPSMAALLLVLGAVSLAMIVRRRA